jgi:hypothetical protein
LLSDVDGAVSRAYVGRSSDGHTVPGVVVVRRDGQIVFRQISKAKDDRPTTPELFAALDRSLGTTGGSAHTGYSVFERLQTRIDVGGGARVDDARDPGAIGIGSVAFELPLGRYLLAGPWLTTDARHTLDVDGALTARLPLVHGIGALQLTGLGGWSPLGDASWNAGVRFGPWLALTPTWAVQLELGGAVRGDQREAFVTVGVSRLFQVRN